MVAKNTGEVLSADSACPVFNQNPDRYFVSRSVLIFAHGKLSCCTGRVSSAVVHSTTSKLGLIMLRCDELLAGPSPFECGIRVGLARGKVFFGSKRITRLPVGFRRCQTFDCGRAIVSASSRHGRRP